MHINDLNADGKGRLIFVFRLDIRSHYVTEFHLDLGKISVFFRKDEK